MSKPPVESRLNITYRTRIDGTEAQKKLPMRFLVLADLTGDENRPRIGQRQIASIKPRMPLKGFMAEKQVLIPITPPALKKDLEINGEVTSLELEGHVKSESAEKVVYTVRGTAKVQGQQHDNEYEDFEGVVAVIDGEVTIPVQEEAPGNARLSLAGKVQGKRVGGFVRASELACQVTRLPERDGDLEGVPTYRFGLAPAAEGAAATRLFVAVELGIPIRQMNDFKPEHVAESVPEIRRLVILRHLLHEARDYIANRSEFREVVKDTLGKGDRVVEITNEMKQKFPHLALDVVQQQPPATK